MPLDARPLLKRAVLSCPSRTDLPGSTPKRRSRRPHVQNDAAARTSYDKAYLTRRRRNNLQQGNEGARAARGREDDARLFVQKKVLIRAFNR